MKALKFTISGQTAFFKMPEVNTYLYFTYGNIHKIAILGIIGAAIGLEGYNFQGKLQFPRFYSELISLNISIVPRNDRGYIPKKIQLFNNSVGYASHEEGGNLIVKEQWLEKPMWDIYILIDGNKNMDKIIYSFLKSSFIYMPYLGKNDHYANITGAEIVELKQIANCENVNSLFFRDCFEFKKESNNASNIDLGLIDIWKYEERLPVRLGGQENQYITIPFIFTNMNVELKRNCKLFSEPAKVLFFF